MRDATLGGLSALEATRPRRAGDRTGASAKARRDDGIWTRFRRFRTRLALIVGSAGFTAIMIGIVVNATLEQKEHHPAPLFGGTPPVRVAAPVHAKLEVPPTPLVAPAPAAPAASDDMQSLPRVAAPTHAASARPRAVDGIARLLGTLPPSDRRRAPGKAEPAPGPKSAQLVAAKPTPTLPAAARDHRPAPAAVN